MEYLLDNEQSESASEVLGDISQEDLEKEIEDLRSEFYQLQLGVAEQKFDIDNIRRRAFLLATIVSSHKNKYEEQVRGKALNVAAIIFEHVAHFSQDNSECLLYYLDSILFYSRGEQEAQSATLARKLLKENKFTSFNDDANLQESWRLLLLFLGREFKTLLFWKRNASVNFFGTLNGITEEGFFWVELLKGCLLVAQYMVWGGSCSHKKHFEDATKLAKSWGNTHLTWLSLTVGEVADIMSANSLRAKLSELNIAGWASEALTMDGFVELWLPHRIALGSAGGLQKGILSPVAKTALINMPTSAGKSLIAEIAIIDQLVKNPNAKAIWVVPSRALVYEVYSRINRHLRRIGINASSMPGGIEKDKDDINQISSTRVFVLTPEKLDGLLRRNPTLLNTVRIVVVDETHKIGESGRGWLLETLIAWLLVSAETNENLRLLFMSAVLPNRPDFEVWLGREQEKFVSKWATWRPTRLALFSTIGGYNKPWKTSLIQKHSNQLILVHPKIINPRPFEVSLFLLGLLREHKINAQGILVFYYTKDDVNNFISTLVQATKVPDLVPDEWTALSNKFASVYGHEHQFPKALIRGVGVDHGDIPMWLRQLVESSFRNGILPTLIANQAVLEGVNFPIEDIIIGSVGSRVGPTEFRYRLKALDYANLVGRVGRAMVDTEGRCFLIWNWFYGKAPIDNLTWDTYCSPALIMEDIVSQLATDELGLTKALQLISSSLEGVDESAFDELGSWRDRLERLHSSSLAFLEQTEATDYTKLSHWMQRTLAWQQLGKSGKESLELYGKSTFKGFRSASRTLYRFASLSGLSVRSSEEILKITSQIIVDWQAGSIPTFKAVFNRDRFNLIVDLRECWRRRPVTYGTKGFPPRIDHYEAAAAWIAGKNWSIVSEIICFNHANLNPITKSSLVAAYVSQMFEFRLPWVLGAVSIAAKELGGPDDLCQFLDDLPAQLRYGVNNAEAISISKLSGVERSIALELAKKYLDQEEDRDLRSWLQHRSLIEFKQWFPAESDSLLTDLLHRLSDTRQRDWSIRREGKIVVELAGWKKYGWLEFISNHRKSDDIELQLRLEPGNEFDRYAIAVDVKNDNKPLHVGYIPSAHSEEISELIEWGREVLVKMFTKSAVIPPKLFLEVVEVDK